MGKKEGSLSCAALAGGGINCEGSALVAVRALFGIKPIRRDAEHIVALDADAMDDGTNDRAGMEGLVQTARRRSASFLWNAFSRHERILARGDAASNESLRHPREVAAHLLNVGNTRS